MKSTLQSFEEGTNITPYYSQEKWDLEKLSNWFKDTKLIYGEQEFKLSPEFTQLITLLAQVNPIKMGGRTFKHYISVVLSSSVNILLWWP